MFLHLKSKITILIIIIITVNKNTYFTNFDLNIYNLFVPELIFLQRGREEVFNFAVVFIIKSLLKYKWSFITLTTEIVDVLKFEPGKASSGVNPINNYFLFLSKSCVNHITD